jgi:hypothetical protein
MMTKQKVDVDAAAVLRVVDGATVSLDAARTPDERAAVKNRQGNDESSSLVYSDSEREQAMSDFEMLAAVDALSTLAGEVRSMVDERMEQVYRQALDAYYVAEELAKDPAHAELVPHAAAMRQAYEQQFGRPIPPKAKK